MNYSITHLTEVADCNVLLAMAEQEKAVLDLKRHNGEFSSTRYLAISEQINAELQVVNALLAASETVLATLPEGPSKEDEKDKKTRNQYRKFVLENRKEDHGTVALLQKEMDLARVLLEITEMDAFIEAIRQRKSELS